MNAEQAQQLQPGDILVDHEDGGYSRPPGDKGKVLRVDYGLYVVIGWGYGGKGSLDVCRHHVERMQMIEVAE